jgi:hypothetical protein
MAFKSARVSGTLVQHAPEQVAQRRGQPVFAAVQRLQKRAGVLGALAVPVPGDARDLGDHRLDGGPRERDVPGDDVEETHAE